MEHESISILIWAIIVTVTLGILVILVIKLRQKHSQDIQAMEESIRKERTNAVDISRSTIKGKVGEQMSPLLPEFYSKYEPADARFLGSPIDYVIFKNMSKFDNKEKREPIEIVLLDVKTGKPDLKPIQNAVKKAVEEGRVKFDVIKPNIDNSKE